jgi:hypothetical protein
MRLTDRDGTSVTLQARGFEFPAGTGEEDDQWLVIRGHVDLGERSWSFTDPCLLIAEAHQLGRWLALAAAGKLQPRPLPDPSRDDDQPLLGFLEPELGFSLGTSSQRRLLLRCHFAHAAAPPWLDRDDRLTVPGYAVDLRVDPADLRRVAEAWTADLGALPTRPRPLGGWLGAP